VVTPDGKSWDEVTRDVGYIGDSVKVSTSTDTHSSSASQIQVFDEWRGTRNTYKHSFNKDFAIAYDRLICLVSGMYKIEAQTYRTLTDSHLIIVINGSTVQASHGTSISHDTPSTSIILPLKRGDHVQCKGGWYSSTERSNYQITKV